MAANCRSGHTASNGIGMSALTAFQTEVARIFFTLPASDGFLLAGGAALLAADLTSRPTDDLDFFGQRHQVDVGAAATQLEHVLGERGWHTTRIQSGPTFVRLHVTGDEPLLVDIAIDAPPARTPVVSMLGPTFDPEELAGRNSPRCSAEPRRATLPMSSCLLSGTGDRCS